MKRIIIVFMLLTSINIYSENRDSLSIGYKLEEINDNLGINLDIVTPTFLNYFNGRISGGYVMEKPSYETYHNKFLIGIRGYGAPVSDIIKLYGELGAVLVLDDSEIDPGIYGLFGFEFFTAREYRSPVSYFIELGTNGMEEDIYNGFTTNVGLRYYF